MALEKWRKGKMGKEKVIQLLRDEKFWNVVPHGNDIRLIRQFGFINPKVIEFTLVSTMTGYEIKHPSYLFVNKISHFRSVQKDVRLSLNKTYLTSIINTLKNTGIWEHIVNKNFIQVNTENANSDKSLVKDELKSLLDNRGGYQDRRHLLSSKN